MHANSDARQGENSAAAREEIERRLRARFAGIAPGRLVSEEFLVDRRLEALAELEDS